MHDRWMASIDTLFPTEALQQLIYVGQVIQRNVLHENVRDIVISHSPMQPAEEKGELDNKQKNGG